MNDEQINDLHILRTAAQQREWTTAQDTLKRLLTGIDPLIALSIPARQAQKFLPRFEKHYPDATWLRELMLTVISYGSSPNELPRNVIAQFDGPGYRQFIVGVFDLAQAVQQQFTVFERYSHLTNATANIILADLQNVYFTRHPAQYAQFNDPETSDEDRAAIQQDFWLDKGVAWRDAATWLEVASDVEDRLHNR
jgi:hypothetical protein